MAQAEGTSEVVESTQFAFMTDEEVRLHSTVKITNPNLIDVLGLRVPGGLYDPAMGPLDDNSPCNSCGERAYYCNGHCGHIDLVQPAYNPLLFNMLSILLNRICFFCFRFRSSKAEVAKCVSLLELISRGDVTGAKNLHSESIPKDKEKGAKKRNSESIPKYKKKMDLDSDDKDAKKDSRESYISTSDNKQARWDSSQLTEAMYVLNEFLRKKEKTCSRCTRKNPVVRKPTFGWFHLSGLKQKDIRDNTIRTSGKVKSGEDGEDEEDEEDKENHGTKVSYSPVLGPLLPSEVIEIVKGVWKNEAPLCKYMCNIQQQQFKFRKPAGPSMFFLQTVVVPPIKFRAPAKGGDSIMEHPHTVLLVKVLQSNIALGNALDNKVEHSKIINRWMDLQQSINVLFDSKATTSPSQKDLNSGIIQFLEKKEGIFRQKMMGKRVNYACRSVISPDPYLAVNEIGIPPYFALRLTYPERVTPWNAGKLRGAVINGPELHPGATTYVDSVVTMKLPLNKKLRVAISRKLPSSRGIVSQPGKLNEHEIEGKTVYRHLQDGDIVLVNRQPTLHKPSIMAHVVRVLKGERTLRMHYANCSSYNADFDGDEINVHFPQDEISRAEAYNIVNANEQYIVPTKGDTVRGLIQDHIVGAVLLTLKNTFLTRSEFSQLLYGSGVFTVGTGSLPGNHSKKISVLDLEDLVAPGLPAVWKPEPLWTGKQVITALLNQITKGYAPCTVENQGKIPKSYFTDNNHKNEDDEDDHNAEHKLLIWKNELVRGVIDKAQFGKFGLVHTVQELYGSNSAGILLSALSRIFTIFLQTHGFTCGLDDLIISPNYDVQRKEKLEGEDVGEEVHCNFVKFKPGQIGPEELQLEIEKIICSDRESSTASLDMKMKNKLTNKLTTEGSDILKRLLTEGILKPFPKNCIAVMTTTGAKGSTVNFQQISAYLGQQELEGKRVPRMVSGKTLPSFPPWDFTSRAGGFITDRFLTALRPQEYYFHCMAGREGLVDTAVKTSRSGYLQRCLIKNLESLKVCYDYTVRDADGSIVQFYYGEDGVDVMKTSFLKNFKALEDNQETICQKFQHEREFNSYIEELPEGIEQAARQFIREKQKGAGKNEDKFIELVKQKYLSSLADSGEPVGVIAAQSVGEPSTQMTLNTFHLAGRGEMNVTLGIPRLQEILMTASNDIKTPILTCPFMEWRPKHDVVSLVSSVKKVAVSDLIENMEIQLSIRHEKELARIYKLIIRFKDYEFVSLKNIHETLKSTFLRELEDAIDNHIKFLGRVIEIKSLKGSSSKSEELTEGNEDDDSNNARTQEDESKDDDGDVEDNESGDDLGSDVQKRKKQATDEMEYEEGSDSEYPDSDVLSAKNDDDDDIEAINDEETEENLDDRDEAVSNVQKEDEVLPEPESDDPRGINVSETIDYPSISFGGDKTRRAILLVLKGLSCEIHFKLTDEPHLLLAQIAQKSAKKVYIKKSGKISQCRMVKYDPDEKTIIWDGKQKPKKGDPEAEDSAYWAMKASGVEFKSFWELHNDLDLNRLYSNNIHAMLITYGVEAARATIIREITQVFDIYGVKVDYRHLSLIADYMTHTGGYRPMSRHGSISESLSPFLKMSFETASKFIVEAASYGLTDNLETPSSRICLGLPVKMGTGSFDVMHQIYNV